MVDITYPCSGVWYPRRRPCGVAINTLVDLINWLGKPQVCSADCPRSSTDGSADCHTTECGLPRRSWRRISACNELSTIVKRPACRRQSRNVDVWPAPVEVRPAPSELPCLPRRLDIAATASPHPRRGVPAILEDRQNLFRRSLELLELGRAARFQKKVTTIELHPSPPPPPLPKSPFHAAEEAQKTAAAWATAAQSCLAQFP